MKFKLQEQIITFPLHIRHFEALKKSFQHGFCLKKFIVLFREKNMPHEKVMM